ncbi:MAG TPA: Flp pilus assembly protein CpaB [Mesorhizobium sp.]|jgi:pilus assembly protein CpaB|nr:Flp pilus assembly protein CpaB [Mesorhizobium sp.]
MPGKIVTMLGIAAVFGGGSIFAADIWVKQQAGAAAAGLAAQAGSASPSVEFATIVVAAEPLRFGMALEPAKLKELPWPREGVPEGSFKTIDELLAEGARTVLSPVEANEPVLLAKLSGPNGRATLSNLLTPGMRAVSIKTDEVAGVGGFVRPGDRVDVILTRDAGGIEEVADNAEDAAGSTIATSVVVENAKVLSVGQDADQRGTAAAVATSVTIEVTADEAQKVALARSVGGLSLSLRPGAPDGESEAVMTTISAFGGSLAASEKAGTLVEALVEETAAPTFHTVVVRRGTAEESYQVMAPAE